jgi:putative FmdB family regulatory protein
MPIYEYHCKQCGVRVEALVPANSGQAHCPHCGTALTDKLISAPATFRRHDEARQAGHTCCGREERCASPPCSDDRGCRR